MGLLTNFLLTGLLVNLYTLGVSSEPEELCLMFRMESNKNIILQDHKDVHNQMKINFDFMLRRHMNMKNTYSMHIREPEVLLDRQNHEHRIDLNRCPSNIVPARLCHLPSLLMFGDDGLLQGIKVDKDEPEVCVNVKLYLASLLQVNKMNLMHTMHMKNSAKDELHHVGTCPVSYEVHQAHDKKGGHWHVTKNIQLDHCSGVHNEHDNLVASAVSEMEISQEKDLVIPQLILYNATIDYVNKGHKGITHLDIDAMIMAKDSVSCSAVPTFVDGRAMTVTSQHLRPADEDLMHSEESDNSDMTEIYSALAHEGNAVNIYQDLYERILRCWERM